MLDRLKRTVMLLAIVLSIASPALAHTPPPSFASEQDLRNVEAIDESEAVELLPIIPASTFDDVARIELPSPSIVETLEQRTTAMLAHDDARTHQLFDADSAELASWPLASGDENNINGERKLSLELHRATEFQALPFIEPMTGLVYARARWYDPASGSFLTPDPMGYEDSSNLYAFAAGDPVNHRDPTGLRIGDWWDPRSYEEAVKPTLKGWWNVASLGTLERVEKQKNLGTWKGVAQSTGQGVTRISNAASLGLQDSIYATQMREGAGLKSIAKGAGQAVVNLTPYEEVNALATNPNLSTEQKIQVSLVAVSKTAGLVAGGKGLYDRIPGPVQFENPYSVQALAENALLSEVEVAYAAAQTATAPARFIRSQYAAEAPPALRSEVLTNVSQCPYCGVRPSTQLEHVDAFKLDFMRGGWKDSFTTRTNRLNAPGNVTGACGSCNPSKGAKELGPGPGQWWPAAWPQGEWWPFGGKPGT